MKRITDYFKRQDYTCPTCSNSFWIEFQDFELHVLECGQQQNECPICGIQSERLQEHVDQCLDSQDLAVSGVSSAVESHIVKKQKLEIRLPTANSNSTKEMNTIKEPIPHQKSKECPWYKWIPKTTITVDAFQYGSIPNCTHYFLSHFHSDHYMGLSKHFQGLLYCNEITARLVHVELYVPMDRIVILPMNQRIEIGGWFVTLMDANHCPGAVIFLFEIGSCRVLHTGDFRACKEHWEHTLLQDKIDYLFLDTTYCNPTYIFPPQQKILDLLHEIVVRIESGEAIRTIFRDQTTKNVFQGWSEKVKKHTLYLVGSYTIGKEKVFMTVSTAAKTKVYAQKKKLKVLKLLEDSEMTKVLTDDADVAAVHVISMTKMGKDSLDKIVKEYPHFNQIVAIKPTGWTFHDKLKGEFGIGHLKPTYISNKITMISIPYSEHSSFSELKEFVQRLKIGQIIPTVNVSKHQEMKKYFDSWV
jgi:DNA cross-link repair 1A protein